MIASMRLQAAGQAARKPHVVESVLLVQGINSGISANELADNIGMLLEKLSRYTLQMLVNQWFAFWSSSHAPAPHTDCINECRLKRPQRPGAEQGRSKKHTEDIDLGGYQEAWNFWPWQPKILGQSSSEFLGCRVVRCLRTDDS